MNDATLAKWLREELPRLQRESNSGTYWDIGPIDGGRMVNVLTALLALLRDGGEFVDMASAADNSGDEYPPTCQECRGSNNHHDVDCRLSAYRARLRAVLGPSISPKLLTEGERNYYGTCGPDAMLGEGR